MTRDSDIQQVLDQVDERHLRADVSRLAALPSRSAASRFSAQAADNLFRRFLEAGYSSGHVKFQSFPHRSSVPQRNVLCGPEPGHHPIVLICAHYDSVSESDEAPGADDNASGVAAMLEIARLLRGQALPFDPMFAALGSEEDAYEGSKECARVARAHDWPIALVVNLDMLGMNGVGNLRQRVVVQHDRGTQRGIDHLSVVYAAAMAAAMERYTSLKPELGPSGFSDLLSFEAEGFVCTGVVEGGRNLRRHTRDDLAALVDFPYLREVTQALVAALMTLPLSLGEVTDL